MKACIVGSGISGLTAALLLAKAGQEVEIFEAGPHPAPLLAGFRRKGLLFDTGFHYGGGISAGGVLRQWLQALDVEKYLEFQENSGLERFLFEDGTCIDLPSGASLLPSIEKFFPHCTEKMQELIQHCEAVLAVSPYTNAHNVQEPSLHLGNQKSILTYFQELKLPTRLQAMLAARCLLYGTPPSQAALEHYALVSGPYFHSCGTWKGGGEALVKVLLQELAKYGAKVTCKSPVIAIEGQKSHGVQAIRLKDGSRVACEQCYFTGHPQQLQKLLPQGVLRPAFFSHIDDIPETQSVLMLFAETTAFPSGQSLYVLTKQHEENPDSMFSCEGEHSGLYMCTGYPSMDGGVETKEQRAPSPLMVLRFLPKGCMDGLSAAQYKERKQQAVQELVALAEKRCPELQGKWRVLDAATERTMRRWVTGSTGSLYGMQHTVQDMPLLAITRMQGLFLAGQNILLPGVLGGIISGALAVGFSLGHDTVLKEFRACAHG